MPKYQVLPWRNRSTSGTYATATTTTTTVAATVLLRSTVITSLRATDAPSPHIRITLTKLGFLFYPEDEFQLIYTRIHSLHLRRK
jgi:hypothetical protein